ncbi:MAG TPA: PH domain-containing protein [Actinomycetota bacterium]|nr:PH domain-containing protein [Actinomycetota bacterium]
MPFPTRLLTEDEHVILDVRPHWKALIEPMLSTMAIVTVAAVLIVKIGPARPAALRWAVAGAAVMVWIWAAGLQLARWKFTEFVLTNERIIARSGVIAKVSREIPLERVNDVTVTQSMLDRVLRSGDIRLESAGEYGQTTFDDIGHPVEVQKQIYEAAEGRRGLGPDLIHHPASVADELAKLADLRDRGALTAEEFDARKKRLLER